MMHLSESLLRDAGAIQVSHLEFAAIYPVILNSFGMGALLMACSVLAQIFLARPGVERAGNAGPDAAPPETPATLIQASAHVLFMCLAICCLILLVENNLARAFTLGAAIALIRFKTKLGEKSSSSALLFAIVCGMSAGIGVPRLGWLLAVIYGIVQLALVALVGAVERASRPIARPTPLRVPDPDDRTAAPPGPVELKS